MQTKYTKSFLNKLEDIFAESTYTLRYEKGNFKSGYCVLKENNVAIVNKYFTLEGKVNALIDILKSIPIDIKSLSEKNKTLFFKISQEKLKL